MATDRSISTRGWLLRGIGAGLCGLALIVGAGGATAAESLPSDATLSKIEVQPAEIKLSNPYAYAQLILTGRLTNGEPIDVTRMVTIAQPPACVKISATGLVRPVDDGSGTLTVTLAGQTAQIPITVSGQKTPYPVSFVRDVMPTMSKMGCNQGTCHGAQKGKNGFQLSLRGYDPIFDHRALTDDLEGRRFNRAAPDQSLMLLKPSGGAPHVGGVLYSPGDPAYEVLKAWIAAGVKLDLESPRVTSLDVFPKGPVVPLPSMKQQMRVIATYSDGAVRDVSAEAFIESSNTEVSTVDKNGLATAVRRGEAAMLARYEGSYAATTLIVMGNRTGFAWQSAPPNNYIDSLVDEKLQSVKVLPSDICSDAEFIRRLYLDLTGIPPKAEEVRAFLADKRETKVKRDELIDKLVGNPQYVEYWTNKWADLLQVNRTFLTERGAWSFRNWIRHAIGSNMPYDDFVRTILTASGSTFHNPPASYMRVLRDADTAMENTTQLFLGVRFNCNKCHDHPFERWTQDQYYQLSAYFAQVGRKPGTSQGDEVIFDQSAGDVVHARTGAVTPPSFPYKHADLAPTAENRRAQLAQWVTSKENQYFSKSLVNRMWSYLLGVGLIEPADDIRAGNPPSNPKLLDRMTQEFVQSGFDVQSLVKTICKSRTYQRSIETNKWNEDDEINYSHAIARRLPAESLFDAIHLATGAPMKLPGLPAGFRSAQLPDSNVKMPNAFLDLFGKPPRESACECERSSGMMLGPVMSLVNGPTIADAIKDPNNRLTNLVATEKDDRKVVEEVFLSILCRMPTSQEIDAGVAAIKAGSIDRDKMIADLAAYEKDQLPIRVAEWEKRMNAKEAWAVLDPVTLAAGSGATFAKQPDGSILVSGKIAAPEAYTLTFKVDLPSLAGLRLEVLPDASLPAMGPGRAENGNFVLNEVQVTAAPIGDPSKAAPITFTTATADFSQESWPVTGAIDNNPQTGWAIYPQVGKAHVATFDPADPVGFSGPTELTITLLQQFAGKDHSIGKFRLSATPTKPPMARGQLPEPIVKILDVAPEQRTPEQKAALLAHYKTLDSEYAKLAAVANSSNQIDPRLVGVQDIAWALLNSPAFLFNH